MQINPYQDLFIQQELAHGTSANNILRGRASFASYPTEVVHNSVEALLSQSQWPYLKLGDHYKTWKVTDQWQGQLLATEPRDVRVSLAQPWSLFVYEKGGQTNLDVAIHHAWADGHSFQLFWTDLMAHLSGQVAERQSNESPTIAFGAAPDLGDIKAIRDVGLGPVKRITVSIPAYRKEKIEAAAASQGVNFTSVLLGSLQQIIAQCESHLELPLQLGMALRNRSGRAAKSDFSSRVNFLPLAHSEAGDWIDVGQRVRHLFRNQAYPLMDWLQSQGQQGAFNVLFSYQKETYHKESDSPVAQLKFLPAEVDETILGVHVLEFGQEHLDISFDVRTDLADPCFWRAVIFCYLKTLNAFPRLEAFNVPAAECNGGSTPYPLWSKFDAAPDDKVALVMEGKTLTYGMLRESLSIPYANEWGVAYLKNDRSVEGIVDLLRAWRAGIPVSFSSYRASNCPAGDWLYLAETSGSTGEPKPLLIGKSGIEHLLPDWENRLGVSTKSVHLSIADQRFDVFFGDLFRSLMLGGTLVIASEEARLSPQQIQRLISKHGVTHLESTPSFIELMLSGWQASSTLQCLICGSEPLSPRLYERLRAVQQNGLRVVNSFGLTEVSIDSALVDLCEHAGTYPVGEPLGDQVFTIVNSDGTPLPAGVWGELEIAGNCVAKPLIANSRFQVNAAGQRQFRTGDRAMLHPRLGLIVRGRLHDDFIKVNGRRIPAKSIESAVESDPRIQRAILLEKEGNAILLHDSNLAQSEVQALLQPVFSRHHLPDLILSHHHWPLNQNGKLDRAFIGKSIELKPLTAKQWRAGSSKMEQELEALLIEFGKPYQGDEDLLIFSGWNSIDFLSFCNQWNLKGYSISPRKWLQQPTLRVLLDNSSKTAHEKTADGLEVKHDIDEGDWGEFLDILNQD